MAHYQSTMTTAKSPATMTAMPIRPATKAIDYEELCQLYLAALSLTGGNETRARAMIEAHCVDQGYAI